MRYRVFIRWSHIVIIFFTVIVSCIASAGDGSVRVEKWNIPFDEAVRTFIPKGGYTTLSIDSSREYQNRIYTHIITINPETKNKIRIVRSKETPVRDLLFFNNKLFMIVEYYDGIQEIDFKQLFVVMKDTYGIPALTKESDFTVYTFKNELTQGIMMSRPNGNSFDTRIYLYSRSLFRQLLMAE
jgi:hypothetical protein